MFATFIKIIKMKKESLDVGGSIGSIKGNFYEKHFGLILEKLGYKIKHIYYSDNNGHIVKSDLKTLDDEEKHISRFYRKKINERNEII